MTCPYCGFENANESGFCANCGAQLAGAQAAEPVQAPEVGYTQVLQNDQPAYNQSGYTQSTFTQPVYAAKEQVPAAYKPISAWGYFGYKLLFCIPVVGFILLIVFSVSDENINRRNFARSYWCDLVLSAVLGIITVVILVALASAGIAIGHNYYY